MRQSRIMLLHYVMGLLILLTGAVHLAAHSFLGVEGYAESLEFLTVLARYRDPMMVSVLGILLVAVAYHGLNGIRLIVSEFRPGPLFEKVVTGLLLAIGIFIVVYGTWTIVGAYLMGG